MSRGPDRDPRRRAADSSSLTEPSARLKALFVLLVGLSGGTMALGGGASPRIVGLLTVGGVVAGAALLWYLLWILG
ncbi:hypothetical protein HTZ84_01010 [Haloterrigena sp. SYSU A558-1]|uniref:Uncharacterized protein n=1 Tax=Haloterrigena gelatinilytica TaxID=2741724 RepID=A0A8J8GN51_9EURY|nr:hypothetical protein [Haloterrigena gelatinilytica]NUB93188.1 hypothetical protein [Haloterrigena gelatinilytica]NUC70902.1 hypothetical protein [Haloterrigena gelatinilytica]